MESSSVVKFCCLFAFLFLVTISCFAGVDGAGPCGNISPDGEAMNLAPCYMAAQDDKSSVPDNCCTMVKKIGQNPSCLCAVCAILLSNTAKNSGIKPENAFTIPKRCNIANRPVGYNCGPYTLP